MRNFVVAILATLLFSVPVCGAEIATTDFSNNAYSVLGRTGIRNTELGNQSAGSIFDYKSLKEGADEVRSQFVNNIGNVTIKIWSENGNPEIVYNQLIEEVLKETDNSSEGDYLRWDIGSQKVAYKYYEYELGRSTVYCYKFDIEVDFITTLEQKKQVDEKVSEIVNGFGFDSSTSEYEKVETIYNYICDTVEYADSTSDEIVFTSYSALFDGKAVCQGYAQLFYKMGEEAGLNVRVIPGYTEDGQEHHGWNIVRIGDVYYNLDATWDSSYKQSGRSYNYFLKGDSFSGHIRKAEYSTVDFNNEYPMASTDYYVTLDTSDNEETVSAKDATKLEGFNNIKPTIKKATRKKVKLAKISGAAKYQIKYSTSKKVKKNVKTASTKKTTYKFNSLKEGKTYYVKVRAYKVVNGKKVSTKWSKIKKVNA